MTIIVYPFATRARPFRTQIFRIEEIGVEGKSKMVREDTYNIRNVRSVGTCNVYSENGDDENERMRSRQSGPHTQFIRMCRFSEGV